MIKYDETRCIKIRIGKGTVRFKFEDGSGITIHRENPDYLREIGQWFCAEVDALPIDKDGNEYGGNE